jgi:putative tricarboxylic transport membrane protein
MRAVYVLAICLWFSGWAWGQAAWRPEKAVEFIVPTVAGGNSDRLTRLAQKILQDRKWLTVPSVVMNRTGGNQTLALLHVNQHPGDAHLVLLTNPAIFTNELHGLSKVRYADLTPLALLVIESSVLSVRTASPIRNMGDLAERLKADPESVSFALPARGGQPHLTAAAAVKAAGADPRRMKVIVFKGSGESIAAVLGGHIDVMVSSAGSVLPQMQAGGLRVLAIAAPQRMTGTLAGVPTFREQGINTTGIAAWRGFHSARALTPAQVAFWDDALSKVTDDAEWKKNVDEGDVTRQYLRSRDFAAYLEAEYVSIRAALGELGLVK